MPGRGHAAAPPFTGPAEMRTSKVLSPMPAGDAEEDKSMKVGDRVTLVGLPSDLNGRVGTLTEKIRNRCKVDVDGAGTKIMHISNLVKEGAPLPPSAKGDVVDYASQRFAEREAELQAAKQAEKQVKSEKQAKAAAAKRSRKPEPPMFAIAGTWDNWVEHWMRWSKEERAYEFTVMITDKGWDSFKILLEGEWMRCYYPDSVDANPYEQHALCGPGDAFLHQDWCWTIGKHPRDIGKEGICYKILLFVSADFKVERVDWVRRNFGAGDLVQVVDLAEMPEWNGLCGLLAERTAMGWQVNVDTVGALLLPPHHFKTIETRSTGAAEVSSSEDDADDSEVVCQGDRVEIIDLKAHTEWNGRKGTVGEINGLRHQVHVDGYAMKLLLRKNLKKLPKEEIKEKRKKSKRKRNDETGPPSYSIAGTWDNWTRRRMTWDVERRCLQFNVQLGKDCEESFQILLDGDWAKCLHPDKKDACTHTDFSLCGPDGNGHGLHWTIGKHQLDKGMSGACYEVRLFLDGSDQPQKVDWVQLDGAYLGAPAAAPNTASDEHGAEDSPQQAAIKGRAKRVLPWNQPEQADGQPEVNGAAQATATTETVVKLPGGAIVGSGMGDEVPLELTQLGDAPKDESLKNFLQTANPEWNFDSVNVVMKKLSKIGIESVAEICALIREDKSSLNAKLREVNAREFGGATMNGLAVAAKRWDDDRREKEWREKREEDRRQRKLVPAAKAALDAPKTEASRGTEAGAAPETPEDRKSLPVLKFKVVAEKALVRDRPAINAPVIGYKEKFDVVGATEETFDGWVRLNDDPGWILRDMKGHRGVGEVLTPLAKPLLMAVTDDPEGPGHFAPLGRPVYSAQDKEGGQARKFKVIFSPQVSVRARPDINAKYLQLCKTGEEVFADAQTYDGWLRVKLSGPGGASKTGWVLAVDFENGVMLSSTDLEEKRAQLQQLCLAEDGLQQAVASLDIDALEQAIDRAREAGVDPGCLEEAQQVLLKRCEQAAQDREAIAHQKLQREELRKRMQEVRNNEEELQGLLAYAQRQAWSDEITTALSMLSDIERNKKDERRAMRERIQLAKGDESKLQNCIEIAEKAGFASEVKLAQRFLDELAGNDALLARKRTAANKKHVEAVMRTLMRAAIRGKEDKVATLITDATEAGVDPKEINKQVMLARIEGATERGDSRKANEAFEAAEDAGITDEEIRRAFSNGKVKREQKAGGVESDSDSGRSQKSLASGKPKSDASSEGVPSLVSDFDSGDEATAADRKKPQSVGRDLGVPDLSFSYEPLILVGSCNNWSVEEARLRFHLQPIKVGPTYLQKEQRVFVKVDQTLEFQLIGAKVGWDFRIYPQSVVNSMLEVDTPARALVARGEHNGMAHGKNFTIKPQARKQLEIRIVWKSNTDVHVLFTHPDHAVRPDLSGIQKAAVPASQPEPKKLSAAQGLQKLLGKAKAVDQVDVQKADARHVADGVDKSTGPARIETHSLEVEQPHLSGEVPASASQIVKSATPGIGGSNDSADDDEVIDLAPSDPKRLTSTLSKEEGAADLTNFGQWLDKQDEADADEEDQGAVSEVD